ncbi:hypothetical protein IAT38_007351 [Cryptococcus sp. DSM 104549]
MALEVPTLTLKCSGRRSQYSGETPNYSQDFDFKIDINTRAILSSPTQYILSPQMLWVACCRGTLAPAYGLSSAPKFPASGHGNHSYERLEAGPAEGEDDHIEANSLWKENSQEWKVWTGWCREHGVPSWAKVKDTPEFLVGRKSWGARQEMRRLNEICAIQDKAAARGTRVASVLDWCEKFFASRGVLKEFRVAQDIVGWDYEMLKIHISSAVRAAGYTEGLSITFETGPTAICVKSSNIVSRALDIWAIATLLYLTFIYALIGILRLMFPSVVGAYWETVHITYPLKFFPALPSTFPTETIAAARERLPSLMKEHPYLPAPDVIRLEQGPQGVHYMVGKTEGEWFKEWEEFIKKAVADRYVGNLVDLGHSHELGRPGLYGYEQPNV